MRAPRVQSTVVLPLFWHHHFDNLTIQEINISAMAIAVLGRLVPISNFYALDIFGLSVVSLSYGQFWLPPGARTGRSETASAEIGAKMLTMPFKRFKVLCLHLHAKLLLSTLNHILVQVPEKKNFIKASKRGLASERSSIGRRSQSTPTFKF